MRPWVIFLDSVEDAESGGYRVTKLHVAHSSSHDCLINIVAWLVVFDLKYSTCSFSVGNWVRITQSKVALIDIGGLQNYLDSRIRWVPGRSPILARAGVYRSLQDGSGQALLGKSKKVSRIKNATYVRNRAFSPNWILNSQLHNSFSYIDLIFFEHPNGR